MADEKYVDFGCLILDVANRASEIYHVRNPEEKRYLCNLVFSNLFLMDKKLNFSFNTIFQAVLNYQKTKDELPTSDVIISALEKIVKAFEDTIQIDLIRQRWEEIKRLQTGANIAIGYQ